MMGRKMIRSKRKSASYFPVKMRKVWNPMNLTYQRDGGRQTSKEVGSANLTSI